jgi:hypothetical protein
MYLAQKQIHITFNMEKEVQNYVATTVIIICKTAQSNQTPDRCKLAQSGHPALKQS